MCVCVATNLDSPPPLWRPSSCSSLDTSWRRIYFPVRQNKTGHVQIPLKNLRFGIWQPRAEQSCPRCRRASLLPSGSHTAHTWCIWLQETWRSESARLCSLKCVTRFDSRFCSGAKFLLGFRDLFFCLFLDKVSPAPSESSNALFWQTAFFTSDVWLFPLATGSFGLEETNSAHWTCLRPLLTPHFFSDLHGSHIRLTDPVRERQVSALFRSSGDLLLHNHADSC